MTRWDGGVARRVAAAAAALLPAAFLAVTGIAKWVDPAGTAPDALRPLLRVASWGTWLRAVGALEVVAAVLLALPRTRGAGRVFAFVLVGALTALLVVNAHDERFVSDCGCLGALAARGASPTSADVLLLRNASLLALLVLSALLSSERRSARSAMAWAGAFGVLVLLAAVAGAQRVRAEHQKEMRLLERAGRARAARLGWRLPPLRVRAKDGAEGSLPDVVRPHDELLVVSTDCPHCVEVVTDAVARAEALAAGGRRLLLLVVEADGTDGVRWASSHGMGGLDVVALARVLDATALGVESVPARLVLDADRRVAAHEDHGGFASLPGALLGSGLPQPLLSDVWQAVVEAAAPGARLTGALAATDSFGYEASLALPDGTRGRLLVRRDGTTRSRSVEVAIALDDGGRVVGGVPLALGSHAALDPQAVRAVLEEIRGRTLDDAKRHLREVPAVGLGRGPAARSLYLALERAAGGP
jgi:hypothetical protein